VAIGPDTKAGAVGWELAMGVPVKMSASPVASIPDTHGVMTQDDSLVVYFDSEKRINRIKKVGVALDQFPVVVPDQ
jgi:hypothetical protein